MSICHTWGKLGQNDCGCVECDKGTEVPSTVTLWHDAVSFVLKEKGKII